MNAETPNELKLAKPLPMTEKERLTRCAEDLSFLAWGSFLFALVALLVTIISFINQGTLFSIFALASGLLLFAALALFLFVQLTLIRVALEKST